MKKCVKWIIVIQCAANALPANQSAILRVCLFSKRFIFLKCCLSLHWEGIIELEWTPEIDIYQSFDRNCLKVISSLQFGTWEEITKQDYFQCDNSNYCKMIVKFAACRLNEREIFFFLVSLQIYTESGQLSGTS